MKAIPSILPGCLAGLLTSLLPGTSGTAAAAAASRPACLEWRFSAEHRWSGWSPNGEIASVRFEPDGVGFETRGSDPMLASPVIEWPAAANGQHVEVDIDCSAPGQGEFYFTNTLEGPNGGFVGKWFVPFAVPDTGRQTVSIWPFWEMLGRVTRIRLDPPGGVTCRLYAIRVMGEARKPGTPSWEFNGPDSSWQPMHATTLAPSPAGLRVRTSHPMGLLVTAVEPFAAARRSLLQLDVDCPGEPMICLYWANREDSGLWGEPVELSGTGGPIRIDLRQFEAWRGTITNLAIGFGSLGGETLTLRSMRIEEDASPGAAVLRLRYLGYASGVGRPGRPAEIRALLECAAGPPLAPGPAVFSTDGNAACPEPAVPVSGLAPGAFLEVRSTIIPRAAGQTRLRLAVGGQAFTRVVRVDPALAEPVRSPYEVPPPRPVQTDYRIGIYYYPGWSSPQMLAWRRQADLPEREPLLGWYPEGRPEVADWHIKWAVENGLSFFVYDWYWRNGREELGAALNEGFLNARYRDQLKFAVMWANHKPFASHTPGQLLAVMDYWLEHYLRRPNYLQVDGRPYVSFYSPRELLDSLGSPQAVRSALQAMRDRARAAGLPGLHIGAVDIPGQADPATLDRAGFDSLTAYTYIRTSAAPVAHSLYRPYLLGYRAKWDQVRRACPIPYYPALAVGWDGPVWYGPRSERRRGRRTRDLEEGLSQLKDDLDRTGTRMALLEAWNEWGEGAYLEPNVEFGFADLEAVRAVFARPGDWPVNIGPEDTGQAGRHDLRGGAAACQPASTRPAR
jgi:hypothetical protein